MISKHKIKHLIPIHMKKKMKIQYTTNQGSVQYSEPTEIQEYISREKYYYSFLIK